MPEKLFLLVEVVELTSIDIFANSVAQVRAIIQQNAISTLGSSPDKFNKEAGILLLELVILSLHLADRIAFNAVGPEKRSRFMDALESSVSSNLAQSLLSKDATSERIFRDQFLALYEERRKFYAPLELPSGEVTAWEGTLFWEAAKGVASAYFPDDAVSMTLFLSPSFSQCMNGVEDLSVRLAGLPDF